MDNKHETTKRPVLVKTAVAHELPAAGAAADGAVIPLDREAVPGEVQRELETRRRGDTETGRGGRRVLVKGLAARAARLCEAYRMAQRVRMQIEGFLHQGEALRESIAKAMAHLESDDAHFDEWEHEGVDFEVVKALAEDLEAFVGKYTVKGDE